MGSKLGGLKAKAKNLENNPNFYRDLGRIGGSSKHKGKRGFALNPEVASRAGKIGGTISRPPEHRKPKQPTEGDASLT